MLDYSHYQSTSKWRTSDPVSVARSYVLDGGSDADYILKQIVCPAFQCELLHKEYV